MSFGILQTIFKKLEIYDKLETKIEGNRTFNQIDYINKEYIMAPMNLEENERLPLLKLKNILQEKRKFTLFKISYKEVRKIWQRSILKTPSWPKY